MRQMIDFELDEINLPSQHVFCLSLYGLASLCRGYFQKYLGRLEYQTC